jgi:hypothetical protein
MFTSKMTTKDAYGGDFESYIQFLKINVKVQQPQQICGVERRQWTLQSILFTHEQPNKKYLETKQHVNLLTNNTNKKGRETAGIKTNKRTGKAKHENKWTAKKAKMNCKTDDEHAQE